MSPHIPNRKELSANMEDYLETIYLHDIEGNPAKVKNIAEAMGVSKPSVTEALSVLQDRGLVLHQKYGDIELTDSGRDTASEIYFRHKLLTDFLVKVLGIPLENADDDACKVEHLISNTTVNHIHSLMKFLENKNLNGGDGFIKEFHDSLEDLNNEIKRDE